MIGIKGDSRDLAILWKGKAMITEVELPKLNSKKKAPAQLIDLDTNEVLINAELTLPAVKRFIKHYKVFGIYTRATHNGVEVSA
jgi:hypothetical protein